MKGGLWWTFLGVLLILATLNGRGTLVLLTLVLALASGASELWARHCLTNVTYRRRLGAHRAPADQAVRSQRYAIADAGGGRADAAARL